MGTYVFKLPDVGEGMHEGEIAKWHIKPGDQIQAEQIILEVQNDKSTVELPSPVSGKVIEIKVAEGTVSTVGDPLAVIEAEGAGTESADAASAETAKNADAAAEAGTNAKTAKVAAQEVAGGADAEGANGKPGAAAEAGQSAPSAVAASIEDIRKVLATPSVRKFARERGVDITKITGTGRHDQVTREDVESFDPAQAAQQTTAIQGQEPQPEAAIPAAAPERPAAYEQLEERVPLRGIRKAISAAMVKSAFTAPHVTVMDEVDVTKLVEFRGRTKPLAEKKGIKLTYLPFIVKALIGAARQFPVLNAAMDDEKGEIVYKKYYNIGIATDTDNGLIVPVVFGAERKNIWTIAQEISDLAIRGREGKLAAGEIRGSTITITNIGSAGGMFFTPILNYPEAAILGTGRIADKPIVRDGELAVGKIMALSLSFDHRVIDGATAQQALNYIKQLLADPELLVLEV